MSRAATKTAEPMPTLGEVMAKGVRALAELERGAKTAATEKATGGDPLDAAAKVAMFDAKALRARLDGERTLSDQEKEAILTLAGPVGSAGHKPIMDALAQHEHAIRERSRRAALAAQQEEDRAREQQAERRSAAWRRCPRRVAEMAIIASATLADGLTASRRDRFVPIGSLEDLVREQWRLARLTDEEIRDQPIPRLFHEGMAPDEEG